MATTANSKSPVPTVILAVIGLLIYGVGTYVVVETAGGTGIHSDYSVTPNGVTAGPPAFK